MRADKQRALLDGALRVFARDGYSRASITDLAAESGVSTRTIYNQYGDKESLFKAVILDSATRVAELQIATADRLLGRIVEPEADLIAFGRQWSTTDPAVETHFAMVRQINADAAHIAPETLRAWRDAGPLRVRHAIAEHLRHHADAGMFTIDDADIAALQLIMLTAGSVHELPAVRGPGDPDTVIRAGVRTFLAAYAARPPGETQT